MLFSNPYRYWFIAGLSVYTYLNTAFCDIYSHFNLEYITAVQALLAIFLITLFCWEFSRILHPFVHKWWPGEALILKRKALFFLFSTFASSLFTGGLVFFFSAFVVNTAQGLSDAIKLTLTYTVLVNLLFHLVNAIFYYMKQYNLKQVEAEELTRMNVQAQLQRMQSQVNPHFLFNNLNVLSGLVMKENEEANRFIESFSKVYHYVLTNQDRELIAVRKELEFLEPYFYLLKKRFPDSIQIKVDIPEDQKDKFIVPVALQMLVENAIKHNIASPGKPLQIVIAKNGGEELVVRNTLQPKISTEPSSKTGLKNIEERYAITTGKTIKVEQNNQEFVVHLPLVTIEAYAGTHN